MNEPLITLDPARRFESGQSAPTGESGAAPANPVSSLVWLAALMRMWPARS